MIDNSVNSYNDEPVYYCKNCLSLCIKTVAVDSDLDYCNDCGSTDIATAHIEEWKELYKQRYGFDYLKDKHYGRDRK